MKRSVLIRLALLSVICWISGSAAINPCTWQPKLISVFNLVEDVIIQINDTQSATIQLRRIGRVENQTDPSLDSDKLIEYRLFNGSVRHPNTPIDLDLNKRIFGYKAPLTYALDFNDSSGHHYEMSKQDTTEFITTLQFRNQRYVCIHGTRTGTDLPLIQLLIYDPEQLFLQEVQSKNLEKMLLVHCAPNDVQPKLEYRLSNFNKPRMVSLVNWPAFGGTFIQNNITLMTFDMDDGNPSNLVRIMSLETGINGPIYSMSIPASHFQYYNIFEFNEDYRYMVCGMSCNLDSNLARVTLRTVSEDRSDLIPRATKVTLRKLLGCVGGPSHHPFNPNSFCDRNRKFLSVFSLGEDLYFQSSGRFWRYHRNRFTVEANPKLNTGNIHQIRYESEFAALLERQLFDTNHPVFGFTFDAPFFDNCDRDNKWDDKCNRHHIDSGNYFRVCLFGNSTNSLGNSNSFGSRNKGLGFYYTPYGLASFRTQYLVFTTNDFCQNMLRDIPDVSCIISVNHKESFNNYVVALNKARDSVVTYTWRKDIEPNWRNSQRKTHNLKQRPMFLFNFKGKVWSFSYDRSPSMSLITFWEQPSHQNPNTTEMRDLITFLNCPFNESTSLVTLKREQVCQNKIHSIQSVFAVGSLLYHQIGQHFYRYDSRAKRFKYDRGTSELFNDYFDTTKRVTGYSVMTNYSKSIYEVLIHGQTSFNFKHLGRDLFAIFTFNESYGLPVLKPVNDINYYSYANATSTLGDIWPNLRPFSPILDAVGYLEAITSDKPNIIISVHYDHGVYGLFTSKVTKHRLLGGQGTARQEFVDASECPYKELLGMYARGPFLSLVAHMRDNPQWIHIYDPRNNPSVDKAYHGQIGKMMHWSDIGDYYAIYCQKIQEPESNFKNLDSSSSPKTLSTILAVLLLILLILAIVVGFLVYTNPRKEGTQAVEKSGPSVETMEPNRPNYTVVRQPEPNIDSKEVQSSSKSDERSVRSERI